MKTDLMVVAFVTLLYAASTFPLIWSLNTLFSLNIPWTFKTWAAGLVLLLVLKLYFGPRRAREPLPTDDRDEDGEEENWAEETADTDVIEPKRTLIIDGFEALRKTKIPRTHVKK